MTSERKTQPRRGWVGVGALSCACLVVSQLLVPLHLALHDHVIVVGPGEHVHTHARVAARHAAEHRHGDPGHDGVHDHRAGSALGTDLHAHAPAPPDDLFQAREADAREAHTPHPVDDHLDELGEPVAPPRAKTTLAAPSIELELPGLDPTPRGSTPCAARGPRPPPPPRASAPRAPPVSV